MKRRGVLGFLAGGAIAGPAMVKSAAVQGLESLTVSPMLATNYVGGFAGSATGSSPSGEYDPLGWAKRDLARFLGKSAEELLRERNAIQVAVLDPDIAMMRSISLASKVRMQRERVFSAQLANERHWLERRIQDALNNS